MTFDRAVIERLLTGHHTGVWYHQRAIRDLLAEVDRLTVRASSIYEANDVLIAQSASDHAENIKLRAEVARLTGLADRVADTSLRLMDERCTNLAAQRDLARAEVARLTEQKGAAYSERDCCVVAIAAMALRLDWPCGLGRHEEGDASWDRDWMNIVYVDFPTGQCSWHIHDSELAWFAFLPRYERAWDGHTTVEKYARIGAWAKETVANPTEDK